MAQLSMNPDEIVGRGMTVIRHAKSIGIQAASLPDNPSEWPERQCAMLRALIAIDEATLVLGDDPTHLSQSAELRAASDSLPPALDDYTVIGRCKSILRSVSWLRSEAQDLTRPPIFWPRRVRAVRYHAYVILGLLTK